MTRIVFPSAHQYRPDFPHRVANYCKPGVKILIQCEYGLGDILMIYPHYLELKRLYPETVIDLKTRACFMELFPEIKADDWYDYIFEVHCYFNEGMDQIKAKTKPQCTCELNFGIPYRPELDYSVKPPCGMNLVGFNFLSSNWLWRQVQCPYDTAKFLWSKTEENGFVCVDLFYPKEAYADRAENKKYDFIDWSLRDKKNMSIQKMFALTNSCIGWAVVSTGTYHLAMGINPDTVLYLKNDFDCKSYSHTKTALTLDVNKPDEGVIKEWHNRMKECGKQCP